MLRFRQLAVQLTLLATLVTLTGVGLAGCGAATSDTVANLPTPPPSSSPAVAATPAQVYSAATGVITTTSGKTGITVTSTTQVITQTASVPAATGQRMFQIDSSKSEVRFIVDEVLFGKPNTVVGRTDQVTGTVTVNLGDYSQTQISPMKIDARSLATDDNMRNRSIRRFILQSQQDKYQFILFTPTGIEGLPTKATVGTPFSFKVSGDLTIRDITKPVTFAMTVTPLSDTELKGSGNATVLRSDYGLTIPRVPGVANVPDSVRLELDFVADAVQ